MNNTPETSALDCELQNPKILQDRYSIMRDHACRLEQERDEAREAGGITFLLAEKHALENELEVMTAKALGWQKQAELDARLLVECREKAERYRLEANAMMAQRDEAREQLHTAVGLLSTHPQFEDKHPEEVLKFVKEAAK